jgi:hypothetical protein
LESGLPDVGTLYLKDGRFPLLNIIRRTKNS